MVILKSTVLSLFLLFSLSCISLELHTHEQQNSYVLTLESPLRQVQQEKEKIHSQTIESQLKQAFWNAWKGTIIGDSLMFLSKQCRHAFFGHHNVDKSVMDFINPIIYNAKLDNAPTVKQANWFWGLGLGNSLFSNHDSIFITKQLCNQISSGTVSKEIKNQAYKKFAQSLILIKHKWDKNTLTAGIIIPPLIFLGARGINMLMQRYAKNAQEHSWIKKIAYATKYYANSFWYKTGTALVLWLGCALYLNRHISADTAMLLTKSGHKEAYCCHTPWWPLTDPLRLRR